MFTPLGYNPSGTRRFGSNCSGGPRSASATARSLKNNDRRRSLTCWTVGAHRAPLQFLRPTSARISIFIEQQEPVCNDSSNTTAPWDTILMNGELYQGVDYQH